MLLAYLDGSGREGGVFSVGAIAYGSDRAKKAARAWDKLWGSTVCHMNELHVRPKGSAFENWTREQAGNRLVDSIAILREYSTYVVAVSCDMHELRRLYPIDSPKGPQSRLILDGLRTAYALCSHLALVIMGELVGESDVGYFFESGDHGQSGSQKFITAFTKHMEAKRLYRHRWHQVLDKANCRLLEGADIVAWEWAKHVQRCQSGTTDMRPSLKALFGGDLTKLETNSPTNWKSPNHRGLHATGAPLERFFHRAREMGIFDS